MSHTKTVLVVEDDPSIQAGLRDAIEGDGHQVTCADTGTQAVELFSNESVDVIILDIMLPEMNGYDVCRKIRETNKQVPIIMLTAKDEEIDKVLGLELGADDYMTKPFSVRELLARIHAAFRRMEFAVPVEPVKQVSDTFQFGEVEIDRKRFLVRRGEEQSSLTMRELRLLEVFDEHPNEVLSRDFLLNAVWGVDYLGTTRTLDQHIAQLRKKVETENSPQLIVTVHGVGYKFNA